MYNFAEMSDLHMHDPFTICAPFWRFDRHFRFQIYSYYVKMVKLLALTIRSLHGKPKKCARAVHDRKSGTWPWTGSGILVTWHFSVAGSSEKIFQTQPFTTMLKSIKLPTSWYLFEHCSLKTSREKLNLMYRWLRLCARSQDYSRARGNTVDFDIVI